MKKAALDIGDKWTGIALSDAQQIIAQPYNTVPTEKLVEFLTSAIEKEKIDTIIVGHPQTLRGTKSKQTLKTEALFNKLTLSFPNTNWVWQDERLSSKHAATLVTLSCKKHTIHARSAAIILDAYLTRQQIKRDCM